MERWQMCCVEGCRSRAIWKVFNSRGRSSNFCTVHKQEIMELHAEHPARYPLQAERILEVVVG